MSSLKQRTISGLKWGTYERFASYGVTFIVSLIIARILSPADYGIVAMISIFLGICSVLVEGGFGAALIKKQDRTDLDFSTVFFYNIVVSLMFYGLLYAFAPLIARFYEMPLLIKVTRIVGLSIVIGAFGTIHRTKLTIAIDFKTQTKISLITLLVSGALGIAMAYRGFGVWALVYQGLVAVLISTILLWYFVRWRPLSELSGESFRELFGFGSKIMLAGLLNTIYDNIYAMVIGKKFTASDLGYFARADSFAKLPSLNISMVIQKVTFPVLSEIQNDIPRLASSYRQLLKMTAFIVFPVMVLLAALGRPLIELLLTEKWLPAVPLMQTLSFGLMFFPIHAINLNLLQVIGRSDLFLRLEIIKKVMITALLFITTGFGIIYICLGIVLSSLIALIINTHYTGKFINVGLIRQLMDIIPMLVISVVSGAVAFLPTILFPNLIVQLLCGTIFGVTAYWGLSKIFGIEQLDEIMKLIKNKIYKNYKK